MGGLKRGRRGDEDRREGVYELCWSGLLKRWLVVVVLKERKRKERNDKKELKSQEG